MNRDEALRRLADLHNAIDAAVAELTARLPGTLACARGCADCCQDDLTVFPVEADLIRHHHADLLENGAPHPAGRCAFLDAGGACRIYARRPYVCRTQGLPLAWSEGEPGTEQRDICPLNTEPLGVPLVRLAPEQMWVLGPWEGKLASLQAEAQGSFDLRREPLRELFRRKPE